jgi:hypothetical protein
MAAPVTKTGTFTCAHTGKGHPDGTTKLTVKGDPVVPFTAAAGVTSYDGCTNPENLGGKCVVTAPIPPVRNPGAATHLTVGGAAALLDSLTANTTPAAAPLTSVDAGQIRLTAT